MATFTVRGQRAGKPLHLTWTDGTIEGDDEQAVLVVQGMAQAREGQYVSCPPAAGTTHDHLQDAWSAYALMHLVFSDTPRLVGGALPTIPDPPPGAVI